MIIEMRLNNCAYLLGLLTKSLDSFFKFVMCQSKIRARKKFNSRGKTLCDSRIMGIKIYSI